MLKPYKFFVTPVCQMTENDVVLGEQALTQEGQPIVMFGVQQLTDFAAGFQAAVDQMNNQSPALETPEPVEE